MRSWIRRLSIGLLIVGLLVGLIVSPAYAIDDPDSIDIYRVRVFQNIFETGDQLFFVRYDVNYSTDPDPPASKTYLVTLYDTDGTTLLFQNPLNYYGHNIVSIYLTSVRALTWESEYVIRVRGNPTKFGTITEGVNMRSRTLSSTDYYTGAMTASRDALGDFLLNTAQTLEDDWEIALLTSGGKLNTQGSITFRAAIPGLQTVCSGIFETSIAVLTLDEATRRVTLVGDITGVFTAGETVTGGTSSVDSVFIDGSQTATQIRVIHTGVDEFQVGETVTGQTSDATIVVSSFITGVTQEAALERTGTRLRNALDNFGAFLGMSGAAFGGLALGLVFAICAGMIFTTTGNVHGAILVSIPIIFFGNFIGVIPYVITWIMVVVVGAGFAITFIMGRFA